MTVTYMMSFDANTSIPAAYQVDVNVTTGDITNTTTSIWLQVYDYTAGTWVANLTLNGTVNTTGTNGYGGSVSSGTASGVPYNDANWTGGLNATTFGCVATNCNDTLTLHDTFNLTVQVIEDGTGAGGSVAQNNATASTNFVGALTSYSVTFQPSGPDIAQYSQVPFEVNYSLAVENATIDAANVSMMVSVTNALTGSIESQFAVPTVTGVSDYSFWVDDANLSCPSYDPTCSAITGTYVLSVFISVDGSASPLFGTVASGPNVVNTTEAYGNNFISFVTVPLSLSLTTPVSPVVSEGNVSFSAHYTGQYVLAVDLSVFSPLNHSTVVFSSSLLNFANGTPKTVVWYVVTPGVYPIVINLLTLYGTTLNVTGSLTIAPPSGGGTVYVNTTNWHNSTSSGILGMSGAAGGTILLVVGLIIGLIVAMVLGRAVYARPAAAPAQPWSETKPSPNSCSVCGKAFATPDELQEHAKTEHGM